MNNDTLNEAPSNLSSVSLRFEDGLIVEEVKEDQSNKQQQQQQRDDTKEERGRSKSFLSFLGNGKKSQSKTTTSSIVTTTDTTSTNHELSIMDLPTPEDIAGNVLHKQQSVFNFAQTRDGIKNNTPPGSTSQDKRSLYSQPISIPEMKQYFDYKEDQTDNPTSETQDQEKERLMQNGGLVWYSNIVPDDFDSQFKSKGTLKMLPTKFYDEANQSIKPRRGNLSVRECDFFTSLIKLRIKPKSDSDSHDSDHNQDRHDGDEYDEGHADNDSDFQIFGDSGLKIFDDYSSVGDGIIGDTTKVFVHEKRRKQYSKWFFSGVLNGWPGLKYLELVKIEYKYNVVPAWRTHWDSEMNPKDVAPSFPTKVLGLMEVRAKLREPGWTAQGWSKESPGYVLYYNAPETHKVPRLLYGTNIIRQFENDRLNDALIANSGKRSKGDNYRVKPSPKCVRVNMISHRYALTKEKWKDKLSYHSFALLEWDHGKYCTVIELAFLNGLGGYNARCNHTEDRDEPVTQLLKCFPPEMVKPWKDSLSEIRCIDVEAKNVAEYLEFMNKHAGKEGRFLDVRHTFSHAVRLTFCSQEQIVQYLINYIRRGRTYSEIRKNCQTFCADFCAFLAGKKDVQPFHPLNRFDYRNQTHYFMYESSMYE